MYKRRPTYKPHQSKISVEDVNDYTTPQGAAMANEEMRRLALEIEAAKKVAAPVAAEERKPVVVTKEPKAEAPKEVINNIENPISVTSDDGSVVVRKKNKDKVYDLDVWDYEEQISDGATFFGNGYDWHPRTAYLHFYSIAVGITVVFQNAIYYRAIHPTLTQRRLSSDSFATDLAGGYWESFSPWEAGINYTDGVSYIVYNYNFYRCTSTHTSSLLNAPGTMGAPWLELPVTHAYLLEPANWFNPVHPNMYDYGLMDILIDVNNLTGKFNGDGWIPFEGSGTINENDFRYIHTTEEHTNNMSNQLFPCWFGSKEMTYHYSNSVFKKIIRFFKPQLAGVYRLKVTISIKFEGVQPSDLADGFRDIRAMLILQKWGASGTPYQDSEFFQVSGKNIEIMTPIRIEDEDGSKFQQSQAIYCILDAKQISGAHQIDFPSAPIPPIKTWVEGVLYRVGDIVKMYNPATGEMETFQNIRAGFSEFSNSPVDIRHPGSYLPWTTAWAYVEDTYKPPPDALYSISEYGDFLTLSGTCFVPCGAVTEIYIPWYKIYFQQYKLVLTDTNRIVAEGMTSLREPIENYTDVPAGNFDGTCKILSYRQKMEANYVGDDYEIKGHSWDYKHARLF